MTRRSFRHLERLRVRWAEVDLQKIVFNGHYLMYFDTAVAGYWRALAMPYHDTMAALQGDLYVRKATVEYLASARYDDLLDVGMRVQRIGNSSIVFAASVFLGERALVTGELVYVFADPATQTSRPVPDALRQTLQAFEDGQPMVTVRQGPASELLAVATPIRRAVFVDEQGIPADLESDSADADAWHAVAFNRLGHAVGTGRLLPLGDGRAKIGRMAVLRDVRGAGVGEQLLAALSQAAREQGHHSVVLSAQESAVGFYRRAGFVANGEPYEEAGITHQAMSMALHPA
ncbi:MAG: YbgC/FadM family acyl-CoA thioesterase [Rubrivivax sp.]|jgi:YbgC/YbaW family acyl-CoA thioester hydrolase|nr:YbgC/FadM family acyl-CoA thioesterase [Rubrivivax sp.]